MSNDAIKGSGPGFIGDLARMGGDVTADMTLTAIKNSGPSFIGDLARQGGAAFVGPVISGTPVLTATEDSAYAGFTVTTSGGKTTYTYALVGTWPTGISINTSSGAVSGTPTVAGAFAGLSVKVTDANGDTDQLPSFTLVVEAAE